ncbi:MAG TPA: hypothetical protein DCO79_09875 [Spirochaeta sp.]|nr:hypothetical protein [Spirochaeta sp.]
MNKLSKSAVVLIILVVAAITLGVVLFFTMPESLSESFSQERWMDRGQTHHFMLDSEIGRAGRYDRTSHRGFGFGFPFLLILAVVLFFVFRGRKNADWSRRNHSRVILDQMYAEEKITHEEYRRKKVVLEEEN